MADWIWGLLLIFLIVAVGIVCSQPLFPILHRMSFDRICDNYFDSMVRNASIDCIGLTDDQIAALNSELVSSGFTVDSINASRDVNWGDDIRLNVVVTRVYRELKGNFTYDTKTLTMTYNEQSKALGI